MKGNTKEKDLNWQDTLKEKTMTSMRRKDKNKDGRTAMGIGENFIFSSHSHSNISFPLFEKF